MKKILPPMYPLTSDLYTEKFLNTILLHCFEIHTTYLTSRYMPSLSISSLSNCAPVHYLYLILEMVILPLLILGVAYYTIYSIYPLIMAFLGSLSLTFKVQMVYPVGAFPYLHECYECTF